MTKTNVLIYSENLQSRTALLVAAFLMREEHMSAKAATEMIRKKRKISINEPSFKELVEYENCLKLTPH